MSALYKGGKMELETEVESVSSRVPYQSIRTKRSTATLLLFAVLAGLILACGAMLVRDNYVAAVWNF